MHGTPLNRELPSPIALRSFEAAARHLSFTRAAQELYVTPSAVSHQVRALEQTLGIRLFLRMTRQLQLTEPGETLLRVLREAFDRIEETVVDLKTRSGTHPLRVGMTSYLASRWLTRRLERFSARHPEVEIHMQLSNVDIDIKRTDLDLAIIWGHGTWPDLHVWQLMPLQLIVVCSPALLSDGMRLKQLEDLENFPLLHESGRGLWEHYLNAVGSPNTHSERNIIMNDPNVVHQACLEGQGVALGAETLLAGELEQGLLIRPFSQSVQLGGYYVVSPSTAPVSANVSAFQQWLREEVKLGPFR